MVVERTSACLLSPTTYCTAINSSTEHLESVTQLRLTGWDPLAVDITGTTCNTLNKIYITETYCCQERLIFL